MATETPFPNVHITTNSENPDSEAKTSSFLALTALPIQALGPAVSMSYVYSTPACATINQNTDLNHHLAAASSGPPYSFWPAPGGSAVCYIHFGPNPKHEEGFWHRTQTIDYVVILEGELELSLDGGERRVVKKGDTVVQRAAMHKWKNMSGMEGAMYVAVALGTDVAVGGEMEFGGEDLK